MPSSSNPLRPAPATVGEAYIQAMLDQLPAALLSAAVPLGQTGTGSVGTGTTMARSDHAHPGSVVAPEDQSLVGWTFDPILGTATFTLSPGTLYLARVKIPKTNPITNIVVPLSGGGTGTTSSWVTVYDLTGVQLGVSADQGGWNSAGTKVVALATPTASQPGGTTVLAAVLVVGGTGPALRVGTGSPAVNQGLSVGSGTRFATLAGQSTPPSPVTLSGTTAATTPYLLFLS